MVNTPSNKERTSEAVREERSLLAFLCASSFADERCGVGIRGKHTIPLYYLSYLISIISSLSTFLQLNTYVFSVYVQLLEHVTSVRLRHCFRLHHIFHIFFGISLLTGNYFCD